MMKSMGMPKTDVNDLPSDNSKRFYSSNARKYFEMEDLEEDKYGDNSSPNNEQEIEATDDSAKHITNSSNSSQEKSCNKSSIITGSIFIAFIVVVIILYFSYQTEIEEYTGEYIEFMKRNPFLGTMIFSTVYILTIAASIPASIFLLCGAFIFGKVFGFERGFLIFCCVDYLSMQIGSLLAFWSARYNFELYFF